ncbi:MAG: hypothetical protein K1X72_22275 [Pyrinomonadaceae bacterium]|nr:hypothetical protein [Pyrinomonadaceae bacterium]
MNWEFTFKILAVVLLGVAAFFLWLNNMDGVFVSAVIGAVCFFVSIRFQITEKSNRKDAETQRNSESGKEEENQ